MSKQIVILNKPTKDTKWDHKKYTIQKTKEGKLNKSTWDKEKINIKTKPYQ